MKVILVVLMAVFLMPLAKAEDSGNKAEDSVTTSKNPITGTVTKKKKWKRSAKNGHQKSDVDVTETTKYKKNGEVNKNVEMKSDSTNQ